MGDFESPEVKNLRKDGKDNGLDEQMIQSLIASKVTNLSQILHFDDDEFKALQLPGFKIKQLKELQKTLKEKEKSQVPERGVYQVKNVKAKFGSIRGGAHVGILGAENVHEKAQGAVVANVTMDVGDVEGGFVHALYIKYLPPKPEDLKLETTDWLLEEMSDGPLSPDFNVKNCEKAFYDKNKNEAYSMEKTSRGRVLVINVNKVEGQEPRDGTDVDRDKLKTLFEQLHFAVTVFNDEDGLGAEEIRGKVKAFADKANREKGEAYVVCLLSHGKGDCLYGTDGKLLPFDTVFSLFDDGNCPDLEGRPKIFLIQACRQEEPSLGRLPTKKGGRSNMVVCYATQAGYEAFRNTTNGSWFIEGVTKVFAKHAEQEDIIYLMYRVHYLVQKKLKLKTAENISPEVRLTLNKKLLFFPGIQK